MMVDRGNYVPDDFDGDGSFSVEPDGIVLHDIWLGTAYRDSGPAACGHRVSER